MAELKRVEKSQIKLAIYKRMESFELNKSHTIWSVLERPSHKVILDHLVVDDELVMESGPVRSRVDEIIEGWTKKHRVVPNVSNYWPLDYIFDEAFSGVMQPIEFLELFGMVSDLPVGKAAGLSGISNELWMHSDRNGRTESWAGFSTFFTAGAFVDDTIWVGSNQTTTQHILNISNLSLFISGSPISIAKKGESHQYLGIFLSSDGLSKPSLAKAHSDVRFFSNLVLKKVVSDKQFLYLVLAVLHPIVSYRMQFSFIPVSVCNKWDALIHKGLKLKSGLPLDFPSDMIHHPFFYGLNKIASLISFTNFCGVLGQLFNHRSHNLQVLCWHPVHPLSSPACIRVSVSNNFLSGMMALWLALFSFVMGCLYLLFWVNSCFSSICLLSGIMVLSLWISFGIVVGVSSIGISLSGRKNWILMAHSVVFFNGTSPSPLASGGVGSVNIHGSDDFVSVCDHLSWVSTDSLSVYTDGLVKNLDMAGCKARAVAFFENINLGLSVCVQSLMLSTLVKLQAVALALECMSVDCSVCLFLDSQTALDACKSEVNLMYSDFRNRCWLADTRLRTTLVLGNDCTDSFTDAAALSVWLLPPRVDEHFLLVDGGIVFGNSRHFVRDVFYAVCRARWEISSGSGFLAGDLHLNVNWLAFSRVWHPDLHMATGFTSRHTADIHTYLIKALHCWLAMAVRKHIYDKYYPSVLCLYCGKVEVFNHMFSCIIDDVARRQVLESCMSSWMVLSGFFLLSSSILQLLLTCASDFLVFSALCKGFETVSIFCDPKIAGVKAADFVHSICIAFRDDIWLVCVKHRTYIEKNGLIPVDGSVPISLSGLASRFLDGVVKLLGVTEAFGVYFGFCKSCSFFSGIGDPVSVNIIV
ncbi:hypothetical protein G9A89_009799 [Geosiphon pyriformis]|nr:hypothetical protein G9A89_009799 [Geosiphon pyriformis]